MAAPLRSQSPVSNFKSILPISLLFALVASGCSPLYIVQAALEQGKILWRREAIETVLQRADLDPERREKLQLVLAVRDYARDALRLNVGGSYASYSYVDREVLSYVLTAAPKSDLNLYTWWFPFVGRVPYKGFFSHEAAQAEAESLQAQGYDTYIRPAPAYSTLGWFDDPLLAHLLKHDKVTLAEVIFHELFHSTLFVKGAIDFNESLGNFVGNRAAILFFRDRCGEGSPEHRRAIQMWEDEMEFAALIAQVLSSLKALYGKDVAEEEKLREREAIFSASQREWSKRLAGRPAHQYRGYANQKLNNAVLLHYLIYLRELALFESLHDTHGRELTGSIEAIRETIQNEAEPFEAVRRYLAK